MSADHQDLVRQMFRDLAKLNSASSSQKQNPPVQPKEDPATAIPGDGTAAPPTADPPSERVLFIALAAGTKRRFGRSPTVAEFARLVEVVTQAYEIFEWQRAILSGAEVFWEDDRWHFDRSPPGDESAA